MLTVQRRIMISGIKPAHSLVRVKGPNVSYFAGAGGAQAKSKRAVRKDYSPTVLSPALKIHRAQLGGA